MAEGNPRWRRPHVRGLRRKPTAEVETDSTKGAAPGDPAEVAELAQAASVLARVAIARLGQLAHPRGGWSDFWLDPGCSTSWVTAYAASALADAAEAPGVSGGQRAIADGLVQAAADLLLATHRDGAWGWAPGVRPDADSTAWAVRVLLAAGRPVPVRSWTFLDRHLGPSGASTYTDPATGVWADPMPEVTAVVLDVLASHRPGSELDAGWAGVLAAGPEWASQWWPDPDHPTAVVLDALRRRHTHGVAIPVTPGDVGAGDGGPLPPGSRPAPVATTATDRMGTARVGAPGVPPAAELVTKAGKEARVAHEFLASVGDDGQGRMPRSGVCALADALWRSGLAGGPDLACARAILDAQLGGGGWPGDARVVVPAQSGGGALQHCVDARGVFTTATVLHAAVALLRSLPVATPDMAGHIAREPGSQRTSVAGSPEASPARPEHSRDERWDDALARAARAQQVPADSALEIFRALTRESLAARSPWPSRQLSSLAGGMPVELSAGGSPGLRFTCEVGDPRLPPPARLRSGLAAVERTAQLLGMGEAWAGRRAQLLGVLADPALPVPEGARFWLWAGADLPASGPAVLKAYLSLHAGDVDDWRARLHQALRMLPPGGTVWPALACLRGSAWGHEVGIGERPGGQWGLKVYYELDRWRPDLLAELIATCDLPISVPELTPDIPGVVRAAHRGRRRAGIALRVDPVTGDVVEITTTVAIPPPLVGNDVLVDRVAAWLEGRGQDPAPLRAAAAAVAPDWVGADPLARMLGLVTLSAGRRGRSATVYVRPRPAREVGGAAPLRPAAEGAAALGPGPSQVTP